MYSMTFYIKKLNNGALKRILHIRISAVSVKFC